MLNLVETHRNYQYRLYRCDKKDRKLRHKLFVASLIWNHLVALQRRYYRLTGKYISLMVMNKHVLKLRRTGKLRLWKGLHSQCCQDVCKRLDDGYQRFFKGVANVHLDNVQMNLTAPQLPPLYVGAIREKSLRLAGRVGDGTILTEMASPAYVRWAREHIQQGMDQAHRSTHSVAVFTFAKVNPDGNAARQAVRPVLAKRLESAAPHLQPLGIAEEAQRLYREYGVQGAAERMPDAWLDELSVSGTPQQASETIEHLTDAGAQSVILLPLEGDPNCLDEYIRYLLPALK